MKHQLQIKWQNAFIDPAIFELVKSLNNDLVLLAKIINDIKGK